MAWTLNLGAPKVRKACYPREHERIGTHGLSCPLGTVIDLSAGGMRVRCEGKPGAAAGSVMDLHIRSENQKLNVRCKVQWVRKASWKVHEIGLRFEGVTPAVAAVIVEFARHGFVHLDRAVVESAPRAAPVAASVQVEDLYQVLGVVRTASGDEIAGAYRKLARDLHPDLNKAPDAQVRFAHVSKAYSVLRDLDLRRRYDELLALNATTKC